MSLVVLEEVSKSFGNRKVLDACSLTVEENEFLIIHGPSGSGKSTLLSLIGLLDQPDSGNTLHFSMKNIRPYTKASRKLLHDEIGWMFQNYALADDRSVRFNLSLFLPSGLKRSEREEKMENALGQVGLPGILDRKISSLSGGEQQRVSMARLLLRPYRLILADEPTGNLDEANAALVMDLLHTLYQQGKTVMAVSHDNRFDGLATRILDLETLQSSGN